VTNVEFKNLMASIPTCVAVVWGITKSNAMFGCTISSLVSVSIQPNAEEILFVLKRVSSTGANLRDCERFKISVLEENQSHIAKEFSERSPANEPYQIKHLGTWWDEVVAEFTLELSGAYERENATLFIAKVISIRHNQHVKPLVYVNRSYQKIEN